MSNVLVTGITGFIGSQLADRLTENGYDVYGLVRHTSQRELQRLKPILDRVHIIEGDLTRYHSVLSAIETSTPSIVFHLGALTPVRLSFDDPYPYITTNFDGTVNLVHAILKETPKTRLIGASTAEVYGWQEGSKPIREEAKLNPASPYAVSKSAADEYIQMANRVYHLRGTILRPINSYGRTGESGFIVEYLINQMLHNETCYIGVPESVRDYMFRDDHVNAYIRAAESPISEGNVYNVSPGNPVTNRELANMLCEMVGFRGKILYDAYPPGYPQRPKSQDPQYLVLDSGKISKQLSWKPNHTLMEGLKITVDMWQKTVKN